MAPGYVLDSCSTGHTLIQTNPLLADDELGLLSRYGLEYLEPDPFGHVAFPDGRHLTTWLDLDRTCEEIARYSKADAEAYRRLLREYDEVKHII
jgi:phytoene dehydrogenase-like protein